MSYFYIIKYICLTIIKNVLCIVSIISVEIEIEGVEIYHVVGKFEQ